LRLEKPGGTERIMRKDVEEKGIENHDVFNA
jgi:hypothetical protein